MVRVLVMLVVSLLSSLVAFGQTPAPAREIGLTAQACFLRYEDNGVVNIATAQVTLDNQQAIVLAGGQAGCVYLRPGAYSFSIESAYPYARKGKTWQSPRYQFTISSEESIVYRVYPRTEKATYTGGWRAKLIRRDKL
jgi:hypothetical protein